MQLKSIAFRASARLAQVAINNPAMRRGEQGVGVSLVQAALLTLKYRLPVSNRKHGAPDGIFGPETFQAVSKFQGDHKLKVDGVVGQRTILKLDSLLPEAPKAKPAPPPAPAHLPPSPSKPASPRPAVIPTSPDFAIGTNDPIIKPDRGAGPWGSKSKELTTIALEVAIEEDVLPAAYFLIGNDATKHMKHYLGNTGRLLTIDLEGMVKEVPSAKLLFEGLVGMIKSYVESLPPGTYDVTSKHAWNGYNRQSENKNWYFAVGGYSVWPKGKAVVGSGGPGRTCTLALEYKFFDRYNWDGGKQVKIGPVVVTDEFMGEFHRQGLAMEYDEVGSIRRNLSWTAGSALPPGQLNAPGSR